MPWFHAIILINRVSKELNEPSNAAQHKIIIVPNTETRMERNNWYVYILVWRSCPAKAILLPSYPSCQTRQDSRTTTLPQTRRMRTEPESGEAQPKSVVIVENNNVRTRTDSILSIPLMDRADDLRGSVRRRRRRRRRSDIQVI